MVSADPEAKARSRYAGRKAAPIREPFQGVADRRAIHGAGADAADRLRQIEHRQARRPRVQHPGAANEQTGDEDDKPRTDFVDDITVDRNEPGLGDDENRKRYLYRRAIPAELRLHWVDEKRPPILQVSDHRHADDAKRELQPPARFSSTLNQNSLLRYHVEPSPPVFRCRICGSPQI